MKGISILSKVSRFKLFVGQKRYFGITDKIMGMATGAVEKSKEKQFIEGLNAMVAAEKYTLATFRDSLDKQLNSWMMYIPGMSSSMDTKKLKTYRDILDKLKPAELDNHELVNGIVRQRLVRETGEDELQIISLIQFFKHTLIISTWLRGRKAKNKPMPESEADLPRMQEEDADEVRNITKAILYPKSKIRGGMARKRGVRL